MNRFTSLVKLFFQTQRGDILGAETSLALRYCKQLGVQGAMKQSLADAGSPSFHEETGFLGKREDGSDFVVRAKAGENADPSKDP
ncbi:hypothetical protein DCM91_20335 [Chitinophaga costaii]|nr:hypothetical protein DCM91_20335 [Chitinophaga costaii]